MGRKALVTYEMVAAAAEALKSEGIDPGLRSIRDRLGVGSSNTTILPFINAWKSKQQQVVVGGPVTLSPALQKTLQDFFENELANQRKALESNIADLQKSQAILVEENESYESDIEEKSETIEALSLEVSNLKGRIGQLETDLEKNQQDLSQERSNSEFARTQLAKAELRLEAMPRLEKEIEKLRLDLENERAINIAEKQKAAISIAKLESELKSYSDKVAKLQDDSNRDRQIIEKLEAEKAKSIGLIESLNSSKVSAEQLAAVANAKLEAESYRNKDLLERIAELSQEKANAIKLNERLQEKLDASNNEKKSSLKTQVEKKPTA